MNQASIHTRRSLLSATVAALSFAQAPPKVTEATSEIPTSDTLLKFNADGTVRPFAGNTVICHLQQQGRTRDAVERIHEALRRCSFVHKLGILPPDSYHMTVYPGANDQGRELTGWPSDLPKDASIEECNRAIADRMRQFHLECRLPLRMKVDQAKTIANRRASTLRMVGADAGEEQKIRKLRDRLVDVFRFRDNKHDEYGFHVTLAYQLSVFTPNEQAEYRAILEKNVPIIAASAPAFEFGNPEFCTFPNMYRFDIQVLLST